MRRKVDILSRITPVDNDAGNLNSMPTFDDVEDRYILIETAQEILAQLASNSPQAIEIRTQLANFSRSGFAADQLDDANQCGSRPAVRKGFMF